MPNTPTGTLIQNTARQSMAASRPPATNQRASMPRLMSVPTTINPMMEKTPDGDCTNPETYAS